MPVCPRLVVALVMLVVSMIAAPAHAQAGVAGTSLPACVARVLPGDTPAAMLRRSDRFTCTGDQHRLGAGDFWAISAPITRPADRVRILSLWQQRLTLHVAYADGALATVPLDGNATARAIQLGAIVEVPLPARAAPATRLLWRVHGAANARGVLLGQRLATAAQSERSNLLMAALYSSFAGLALALLFYNLALWGAMRHRFQLAYCAMVAALLGYGFSSSGVLAWAWPAIENNDRLRINYCFLGWAAAAALVFARTFFEKRVFAGWVGRLTTAATAMLIACGPIFALATHLDMPLADRVYSWAFIAGLATVPAILWRAWACRSDYRWLFALAWAAPVMFACARLLNALHVLPTTFWLDNSTVLSMGAEALFSSLAIAYRVQTLRSERDEALAGEQVARQLADTDPLTGLLNRRAFLAQLPHRAGEQVLHVIDIDHFKQLNETLGHDGGDEVLRVYARTLRALTPADALVARIGGEEFAVVTAADRPLDPDGILARLRAARMPFDIAVTSSIGSCTGTLASEGEWKRLYHRADRALFAAKAAGRDRARRALPLAA